VTIAFLGAAALLFLALRTPSKPATAPPQPEGWNSSAIRSSFEGVQVKEVDPAHAALSFSYDLENTTDSDYHLSNDPKVLIVGRLKSNGSLKPEDSMRIDNSIFLPARNRARIALKVSYSFNWPAQMFPGQVGPVGQLVNLVDPVYPPDAEQQRIEGTVKLRATIGVDGSIKDLQPLSGPALLLPAALIAVREWRYNPTLLNGQPIETQEDISLVFRLPD